MLNRKYLCNSLGDKGSVIVNNNDVIEIEPKVDKVDTTGAGVFASGFYLVCREKKNLKNVVI